MFQKLTDAQKRRALEIEAINAAANLELLAANMFFRGEDRLASYVKEGARLLRALAS